jgi:MOSC domain-containing protein YiiM
MVTQIYIAPRAGAPMQRVHEIEAIAGGGLAGDRYLLGTGYYTPRNVCEVTLIEEEALERMDAEHGVAVSAGEHRRNLVTRGVRLPELRGRRFAIGGAVFEYDRSRPPCGYLERITQRGMARAMGEGAGICVSVVSGGILREGDALIVLAEPATRRARWLP